MIISSPPGLPGSPDALSAGAPRNKGLKDLSGFGSMLSSALEDARENNVAAESAARDLALGKDTDIHSTMIAIEKADISFQFLMQIRNKIISAYETVMRTQV